MQILHIDRPLKRHVSQFYMILNIATSMHNSFTTKEPNSDYENKHFNPVDPAVYTVSMVQTDKSHIDLSHRDPMNKDSTWTFIITSV